MDTAMQSKIDPNIYAHLPNASGIYMIEYPNGKKYVGQSISIRERIRGHIKHIRCKSPEDLLPSDRALQKYGPESCQFSVLEKVLPEHLNTRESFWILSLGTSIALGMGYNCVIFDNQKLKFSDEARQRMSLSARRKPKPSEETKQKIRLSMMGHKRNTPEMIKALIEYNTTRSYSHSAETRAKISAKTKGKTAWNRGVRRDPKLTEIIAATRKANGKPGKSRPILCLETGEEFATVKEAVAVYGPCVKYSMRLLTTTRKGLSFRYKEKVQ